MTSIALIVTCFYSQMPRWMDLFLESCRWNPSVQFFLVTNLDESRLMRAANITVVCPGEGEFRKRASDALGFEVPRLQINKLMDLKPAYCAIYEDLVSDFDFCGYCDNDLVFGDIRAFMSEDTLTRYDVISALKAFPSGHFTLFRREFSKLYERSRDYRKVFTTNEMFSFSECGYGLHFPLLRGGDFDDVAGLAKVDSMMHVLARSPDVRVHYNTICDEYLPQVHGSRSKRQKILWDRGKMHDLADGRELMYYHLQSLKSHPRFYLPPWGNTPSAFTLSIDGARPAKQDAGQRLATTIDWSRHLVAQTWRLIRRFVSNRLGRMRKS